MTKFAKIDELIRPVCRVQGGEEMNGHTKDWSLDLKNLLAGVCAINLVFFFFFVFLTHLPQVVGGKQVRFEAQLNVHSSTHQKGNNTKERRERSGSGLFLFLFFFFSFSFLSFLFFSFLF